MADVDQPVKLGIQDLKPVLALVLEMGNVVDKIGHDTSLSRWGNLLMLIDEVAGLSAVSWNAVVPEIKDLDDAEKAELLAFIETKLQLQDVALEAALEQGLGIIADAVALVQKTLVLIKSAKGA